MSQSFDLQTPQVEVDDEIYDVPPDEEEGMCDRAVSGSSVDDKTCNQHLMNCIGVHG